MSKTLTIAEVQAKPLQVIADACNGEDIIITRNNRPVLHLVPVAQTGTAESEHLAALQKQREKAIESIKERRKNRLIPAATIEEIIAWRDEGRK